MSEEEREEFWNIFKSGEYECHTKMETFIENKFISKDKIREIFQFYIERDSLFNDDAHKMAVIRLKDVSQELLEENKK